LHFTSPNIKKTTPDAAAVVIAINYPGKVTVAKTKIHFFQPEMINITGSSY
jgi:hypothetical protein